MKYQRGINIILKFIFLILFITSNHKLYAFAQIEGSSNPVKNEIYTYYYENNASLNKVVVWMTTESGEVLDTWLSADSRTAYAHIRWIDTGYGEITLKHGTTFLANKSITAICGIFNMPDLKVYRGAIETNESCSPTSFSIAASIPNNENTARWYYSANDPNPFYSGLNYTTPTISSTTTYYVSGAYELGESGVFGLCESPRKPVILSIVPLPTAPTFEIENYICDPSGTALINAFPGNNGNNIKWYTTSSGGTAFYTGGAYTTPTLTANTTFYISTYNSNNGCESSVRTPILINVNLRPGVPVVNNKTLCGPGLTMLSGTPGQKGTNIYWTKSDGSYVGTGTSLSVSVSSTTVFYAKSINEGCASSSSSPLTVTVRPPISSMLEVNDNAIYGSGTVDLYAFVADNTLEVSWHANPTNLTPLATGLKFTTPALTASTTYYIRAKDPINNCLSEPVAVLAIVKPLTSPGHIQTDVIRVAGKKDEASLANLTDLQKVTQLSYLDGMGRVQQEVVLRGSPGGKDLIQPTEYDNLGRISKSYLPYASSSVNGSFHSTYQVEQKNFYQAANDKVANDAFPFARSVYESSPLGRLTEQGGAGEAWQPGSGHSSKAVYSFNTGATANEAEEVRNFESDGTSSSFFSANKLERVQTTDEHGRITIVFKNSSGLTLATKKQLDETIDGVMVTYLQTYYIYDDFGQVRYIISPKGVALMRGNGWVLTDAIKDNYVHQFSYDYRKRLVAKKTPGQAWVYLVYDKLDRLALTQDGSMRTANKWTFIKYDRKGRSVMTGFYTNATQKTRVEVQTLVDALYTSTNATYPEQAWFEIRGSTLHGYSNTSFPKTNADGTPLEVLTADFYDTYDLDDADALDDYTFSNDGMTGSNIQTQGNTQGLRTGSKHLVMGSTKWIYNYTFYDKYGRVIQIRKNNPLNATADNLITNVYDFEGKVVLARNYHNAGGGRNTTVLNKYEYDTQGRLKKAFQNNNNAATDKLVAEYNYNELGQQIEKNLGGFTVNSVNSFLQSVDFRYTIRGQLSSINNSKLINDNSATNDETNDVFGMELLYHSQEAALGNTAYFDGQISAVKWKVNDVNNNWNPKRERSYQFEYDKLGRLKNAFYKAKGTTNWDQETGGYDEKGITYDHQGNITGLQRYTLPVNATTPLKIDGLTYTYLPATTGDKLTKVEDNGSSTEGFKNGSNIAEEYTYDISGNIIADKNKNCTFQYNALNKVAKVDFGGGNYLLYSYDATGSRIKKDVYTNNALSKTLDYVDGFVYENNTLAYFGMAEGRIRNTGTALEYEYFITDHQGNVRISFVDAGGVAKVRQENHYYPFGLSFAGQAVNTPVPSPANKNLYNEGSELQDEFGLALYSTFYREYDPALGRFHQVDPMAHITPDLSPYHYANNNPIFFNDPNGDLADGLSAGQERALKRSRMANDPNYWSTNGEGGSDWMNWGHDEQSLTKMEALLREALAKSDGQNVKYTRAKNGSFVGFEDVQYLGGLFPEEGGQGIISINKIILCDFKYASSGGGFGWVDGVQLALDGVGMTEVPILSQGAELISAGISFYQGDVTGGLIGLGSMIPIGGKAFEAMKVARRMGKAADAAKGGGSNLWKVGAYNKLKGLEAGLDAHHVGQKAVMSKLVDGYDWKTAPSILVPALGHTSGSGVISRATTGFTNARQVIARDIFELRRVYGSQGIPNSSLQQLIQMNKTMYPEAFIK